MENEHKTAVLTHILGILTLFVGPLVVYFLFRKRASPWLREHLNESVNYHILVLAAFILLVVLAIVFTQFGWAVPSLLAFLAAFLVFAASLVFGVIATLKAAKGQAYHFPLDIKMVK